MLIEELVLNPVLIFLVFTGVLLAVTRWAQSQREMPGYLLGWLIGIFCIIIYQSLTGSAAAPEPEVVEEVAEQASGRLTFAALMIPSIAGIGAGLVASAVYAYIVRTHARRSIAVAIMTAALILTLFLIATVSDTTSRMFGVFALAFGIGVLGTLVVSGGGSADRRRNVDRTRDRYREPPPPQNPPPHMGDDNIPSADPRRSRERFDQIRRKFDD